MKIEEHYGEEYYNSQFKGSSIGSTINIEIFKDFIESGDTVLDFGCGGGFLLTYANCKERFGVEINEHARAHAAKNGINAVSSIDELQDDFADVIISNHALEHTTDPLHILKSLFRKLKVGGTLVVAVPCDPPNFRWLEDDRDMHLFSWSVNNIANLAKVAGYKVIRSEQVPLRWPPKMELIRKFFGHRGLMVAARLAHFRPGGRYQVRVVAQRV